MSKFPDTVLTKPEARTINKTTLLFSLELYACTQIIFQHLSMDIFLWFLETTTTTTSTTTTTTTTMPTSTTRAPARVTLPLSTTGRPYPQPTAITSQPEYPREPIPSGSGEKPAGGQTHLTKFGHALIGISMVNTDLLGTSNCRLICCGLIFGPVLYCISS